MVLLGGFELPAVERQRPQRLLGRSGRDALRGPQHRRRQRLLEQGLRLVELPALAHHVRDLLQDVGDQHVLGIGLPQDGERAVEVLPRGGGIPAVARDRAARREDVGGHVAARSLALHDRPGPREVRLRLVQLLALAQQLREVREADGQPDAVGLEALRERQVAPGVRLGEGQVAAVLGGDREAVQHAPVLLGAGRDPFLERQGPRQVLLRGHRLSHLVELDRDLPEARDHVDAVGRALLANGERLPRELQLARRVGGHGGEQLQRPGLEQAFRRQLTGERQRPLEERARIRLRVQDWSQRQHGAHDGQAPRRQALLDRERLLEPRAGLLHALAAQVGGRRELLVERGPGEARRVGGPAEREGFAQDRPRLVEALELEQGVPEDRAQPRLEHGLAAGLRASDRLAQRARHPLPPPALPLQLRDLEQRPTGLVGPRATDERPDRGASRSPRPPPRPRRGGAARRGGPPTPEGASDGRRSPSRPGRAGPRAAPLRAAR